MKFSEMQYIRPDVDAVRADLDKVAQALEKAASADEQIALYKQADEIKRHTFTMATIASVRHSIDTRDEFYTAENDFMDESSPVLQEKQTREQRSLLFLKAFFSHNTRRGGDRRSIVYASTYRRKNPSRYGTLPHGYGRKHCILLTFGSYILQRKAFGISDNKRCSRLCRHVFVPLMEEV